MRKKRGISFMASNLDANSRSCFWITMGPRFILFNIFLRYVFHSDAINFPPFALPTHPWFFFVRFHMSFSVVFCCIAYETQTSLCNQLLVECTLWRCYKTGVEAWERCFPRILNLRKLNHSLRKRWIAHFHLSCLATDDDEGFTQKAKMCLWKSLNQHERTAQISKELMLQTKTCGGEKQRKNNKHFMLIILLRTRPCCIHEKLFQLNSLSLPPCAQLPVICNFSTFSLLFFCRSTHTQQTPLTNDKRDEDEENCQVFYVCCFYCFYFFTRLLRCSVSENSSHSLTIELWSDAVARWNGNSKRKWKLECKGRWKVWAGKAAYQNCYFVDRKSWHFSLPYRRNLCCDGPAGTRIPKKRKISATSSLSYSKQQQKCELRSTENFVLLYVTNRLKCCCYYADRVKREESHDGWRSSQEL